MTVTDLGRAFGGAVLERLGRAASRVRSRTPLDADVLEDDDEVLVVFDAPGAETSDVQVSADDGEVEVRIDRFRAHRQGYEMRFPGRGLELDGRVDLPDDVAVDPDGARARLNDDGTLYVFVPKVESGADESSEADESGADEDHDDTGTGA